MGNLNWPKALGLLGVRLGGRGVGRVNLPYSAGTGIRGGGGRNRTALLKLIVFGLSMSYFDFFSLSSFCLAFGGFSRQPGHFPYISAQTQTRLLTRVVVL